MELDGKTIAMVVMLAGVLILEMRLLRRKLEIVLAALLERSRRRDARQRRRESMPPPIAQPQSTRRTQPYPVVTPPDEWPDDESTDLHELMELERAQRHKPQRRGERPPRPGTRSDKPYEDER